MNRRSSTVRRARTNELQQLAGLLAAAFYDDPVWGPYFFPDQRRRLEGLTRFFAGELRQFMPHELIWTIEDVAGVTVWAPPGHWQVPPRESLCRAPSIARAFGRGLPRVLRATTMVEKQHPGVPLYYLPYIGVAPARQGNGLGTALLRPVLDRCDTEGAPAYLEATNQRNLPLYRRRGSRCERSLTCRTGHACGRCGESPVASGPAGGDGGWAVSGAPMERRGATVAGPRGALPILVPASAHDRRRQVASMLQFDAEASHRVEATYTTRMSSSSARRCWGRWG